MVGADGIHSTVRVTLLRDEQPIQRGSRGNAGVLHLPDGPAQRRRDAHMAVHAALKGRTLLYAHETGRSVLPVREPEAQPA